MNKFLSIVAVSSILASCAFAQDEVMSSASGSVGEKSGLFVGVHGGVTLFGLSAYDIDGKKYDNYKDVFGAEPMEISFDIGAKIGYQHFFMPLVGIRGYLSYDFEGQKTFAEVPTISASGNTKVSGIITGFHNIVFNVDALINFINNDRFTFGAYAGFGLGYGITNMLAPSKEVSAIINQMKYGGFNIPLNIGVAATFATHHKVELGAKIQTLAAGYTLKDNNKSGVFINPYVINIGYSYIF